MRDFFTYSGLKAFFLQLLKYGPVTSFEAADENTRIILRHDVDFDPIPAQRMAEFESELGVRSTFFFLTSSPTYNIQSHDNRRILKKLADDGFEIGLHFDPTLYPDRQLDDIEIDALSEANLIESIIGREVKTVSLHNPSMHGQYPSFRKLRNAYSPEYFQPENYLSDSRMQFREKTPLEFIKRAETNRLQILLHPIHYSTSGQDYVDLTKECVYRFADTLEGYISANTGYADSMKGRFLRDTL